MKTTSKINYEYQRCLFRLLPIAMFVFQIIIHSESYSVPSWTVKNAAYNEKSSPELEFIKNATNLERTVKVDKAEINLFAMNHTLAVAVSINGIGKDRHKHRRDLRRNVGENCLCFFHSNQSLWLEFPMGLVKGSQPKEKISEQSVSLVPLASVVEKDKINGDPPYSSIEKKRHPCHLGRHFHASKSNCLLPCKTKDNNFARVEEFEGSSHGDNGESEVNSREMLNVKHNKVNKEESLDMPEMEDIVKSKVCLNGTASINESGQLLHKNPYNSKYTFQHPLKPSDKSLNDGRSKSTFKNSLEDPRLRPLMTSLSPLGHLIVQNFKSVKNFERELYSVQSRERSSSSRNLLQGPTGNILNNDDTSPVWKEKSNITTTATYIFPENTTESLRKVTEYTEKPRSHELMSTSSQLSRQDIRSNLIKDFKMSHPVNTWASFGLFKEDFLESVDSHWLSYGPASPYTHTILGAAYFAIMIIGIGGNLLVVLMFIRCRSLRTPPNYLIVNLAVSDCLMMLKMPIFIVNSAYGGPVLGSIGCKIYGFVGGLSGTVSIMTLSAIAVDRYTVIAYPLEPMKRTTSSRALGMVGVVWIYSTFFASLPVLGINSYIPEGYLTSCSFDYLSPHASDRIFVFIYFLAAFVVPLSLIVFSYAKIFRTVHTSERQEIFNPVTAKGSRTILARESFKCKRDSKKQKTEMKIAVLSSTIIVVWLVAWTPYAVVSLLGIFGYKRLLTPLASAIPALFCKMAGCIDPFLYAIKHPRFQRELQAKLPAFPCRGKQKGNNGKTSPEPSFSSSGTNRKFLDGTPQKNRPSTSVTSTPLPRSRDNSRLGSSKSPPAHLVVNFNLGDMNGSRVTASLLRNPGPISKGKPVKSSLRRKSECQCQYCLGRSGEQDSNLSLKPDRDCSMCSRHACSELKNNRFKAFDFERVYYGGKCESKAVCSCKLHNEPSRRLESQVINTDCGDSIIHSVRDLQIEEGKFLHEEMEDIFEQTCQNLCAKQINGDIQANATDRVCFDGHQTVSGKRTKSSSCLESLYGDTPSASIPY